MSLKAMTCAMALRGVTASEKLLLLALANYADENMTCFPSHKRLADDACLSARTVRTLLAAMEGRGLISRQDRYRPDGSRSSDAITLHFSGELAPAAEGGAEILAGGTEMVSGGVGKSLPGGTEMVSPLTTFEPVIEPVRGTERGAGAPATPKARKRCPEDWSPTQADIAVGEAEGMSPGEIDRALAKMRDHTFKTARSDWSATFRNWLRADAERKPRNDRPDSRHLARLDNYAASAAGADRAAQVLAARRAV